jgi:glycine betaine/proline transport system substrate-binding protein
MRGNFKSGFAIAILSLGLTAATGAAIATEPQSCKKVRFSDVGWTDITATTAVASVLLEALGYEPEIQVLSVPVTYQSLKNKDVDVFLGNWMPSMTADVKPFTDEGSVEVVGKNLVGAGYGLVVPSYVAEAGVKSLTDIGPHKDKFDGKIYGIEPGNDGNRIVLGMIEEPKNGLQGFELVESSEAFMLEQALEAMKKKEWIVFLGWTPHPIMGEMKIHYLEGMGDTGFGAATVFTNVRSGFAKECPNAGRLVKNLRFDLPMENQIMDDILKGNEAKAVAREWLKVNMDTAKKWLKGVTTFGGDDGAAAVAATLGS